MSYAVYLSVYHHISRSIADNCARDLMHVIEVRLQAKPSKAYMYKTEPL